MRRGDYITKMFLKFFKITISVFFVILDIAMLRHIGSDIESIVGLILLLGLNLIWFLPIIMIWFENSVLYDKLIAWLDEDISI